MPHHRAGQWPTGVGHVALGLQQCGFSGDKILTQWIAIEERICDMTLVDKHTLGVRLAIFSRHHRDRRSGACVKRC